MKTVLTTLALIAAGTALPVHAQCPPSGAPEGLAFNATGNLWVAYTNTDTVAELLPPVVHSGAAPFSIPWSQISGLSGPTRLAFEGNDLFVTNSAGNTVTVYNTASSQGTPPLVQTVSGLRRPLGIGVDAQGNFYVADNQTNDIAGFRVPYESIGVKTDDNTGHQFLAPGAIAVNGGYVYVATNDGTVHSYSASDLLASYTGTWHFGKIPYYSPPYPPKEVHTYQDSASGGPTGIAFDAQGNVYVAYYYSSDVVKYSASGQKLWTITNGISYPEGIAVDQSGNVFVANTGTSDITVYSSSGASYGALTYDCFE